MFWHLRKSQPNATQLVLFFDDESSEVESGTKGALQLIDWEILKFKNLELIKENKGCKLGKF
jgi:hypothetical protein